LKLFDNNNNIFEKERPITSKYSGVKHIPKRFLSGFSVSNFNGKKSTNELNMNKNLTKTLNFELKKVKITEKIKVDKTLTQRPVSSKIKYCHGQVQGNNNIHKNCYLENAEIKKNNNNKEYNILQIEKLSAEEILKNEENINLKNNNNDSFRKIHEAILSKKNDYIYNYEYYINNNNKDYVSKASFAAQKNEHSLIEESNNKHKNINLKKNFNEKENMFFSFIKNTNKGKGEVNLYNNNNKEDFNDNHNENDSDYDIDNDNDKDFNIDKNDIFFLQKRRNLNKRSTSNNINLDSQTENNFNLIANDLMEKYNENNDDNNNKNFINNKNEIVNIENIDMNINKNNNITSSQRNLYKIENKDSISEMHNIQSIKNIDYEINENFLDFSNNNKIQQKNNEEYINENKNHLKNLDINNSNNEIKTNIVKINSLKKLNYLKNKETSFQLSYSFSNKIKEKNSAENDKIEIKNNKGSNVNSLNSEKKLSFIKNKSKTFDSQFLNDINKHNFNNFNIKKRIQSANLNSKKIRNVSNFDFDKIEEIDKNLNLLSKKNNKSSSEKDINFKNNHYDNYIENKNYKDKDKGNIKDNYNDYINDDNYGKNIDINKFLEISSNNENKKYYKEKEKDLAVMVKFNKESSEKKKLNKIIKDDYEKISKAHPLPNIMRSLNNRIKMNSKNSIKIEFESDDNLLNDNIIINSEKEIFKEKEKEKDLKNNYDRYRKKKINIEDILISHNSTMRKDLNPLITTDCKMKYNLHLNTYQNNKIDMNVNIIDINNPKIRNKSINKIRPVSSRIYFDSKSYKFNH
jgi:hypothetical protein